MTTRSEPYTNARFRASKRPEPSLRWRMARYDILLPLPGAQLLSLFPHTRAPVFPVTLLTYTHRYTSPREVLYHRILFGKALQRGRTWRTEGLNPRSAGIVAEKRTGFVARPKSIRPPRR